MIKHLDGICHVYIDDSADTDKAVRDRRQRQDPALRHLQHDGDAAGGAGHRAARCCPRSASIYAHKGVEMRADPEPRDARSGRHAEGRDRGGLLHRVPGADRLDRVVKGLDEAIEHIAKYGSQHTDAIVTEDSARARALPARGRFELGDGERLDALRRRLRIRPRRRDRHLHRQAARARPGRASKASPRRSTSCSATARSAAEAAIGDPRRHVRPGAQRAPRDGARRARSSLELDGIALDSHRQPRATASPPVASAEDRVAMLAPRARRTSRAYEIDPRELAPGAPAIPWTRCSALRARARPRRRSSIC